MIGTDEAGRKGLMLLVKFVINQPVTNGMKLETDHPNLSAVIGPEPEPVAPPHFTTVKDLFSGFGCFNKEQRGVEHRENDSFYGVCRLFFTEIKCFSFFLPFRC